MATIILDKTVFAQEPVTTNEIEYSTIVDDSVSKVIATQISFIIPPDNGVIVKPLILWKGEEYDAIGQWTDEQAEARIKELLES